MAVEQRTQLRRYTRWTELGDGLLAADLLGSRFPISVDPSSGRVFMGEHEMEPDEARMIGVRLIEAATRADGDRTVRAIDQ
jgi:hypothetical protein